VSESTIQWVLYEQLKRVGDRWGGGDREESTTRKILRKALGAGFFAKLIATVATYPHEVCCPKLQQLNGFVLSFLGGV
jgi:hypothetical protein